MPGTKERPAKTGKPTNDAPRTLANCVEWQQALDKEAELAAEAQAIEAEITRLGAGPAQSAHAGRIGALVGRFLGTEPSEPQATETDQAALAERREACQQAIAQHRQATQRLRGELAAQVYRAYQQEHREKRAAIVKDVLSLLDHWQELSRYVTTLMDAGAIVDSRSAPLFNMAAMPTLRHMLQTVRAEQFRRDNSNLLD